jgi:succinate dehydrogenase cytochrome b subunit
MSRLRFLWRTSVGQKAVMAVTGIILFGYIVLHMAGNLKIFAGPEHLNGYAEFLRTVGAPMLGRAQLLWVVRIVLLAAVTAHTWAAARLTRQAYHARAEAYRRPVHLEETYASRTMRVGGVLLTAFVVYHVLHMTLGTVHADFRTGDPYHNMVVAFHSVPVTIAYTVAIVALGLHLRHGLWSALQTLGINKTHNLLARWAAAIVAAAIVIGFLAGPYAILFGFLGQ